MNTRVNAETPARRGGEKEVGTSDRVLAGCSVGFIYPHCDSPFVNHTVYFSKQRLKDAVKVLERMRGNDKKGRKRRKESGMGEKQK